MQVSLRFSGSRKTFAGQSKQAANVGSLLVGNGFLRELAWINHSVSVSQPFEPPLGSHRPVRGLARLDVLCTESDPNRLSPYCS
jgi:hypothetical protein